MRLPIWIGALAVLPGPAVAEPDVVTLWDHRPEAERWTEAALDALDAQGAPLVDLVPEDIEAYCPGYAEADEAQRKKFWVFFLSALAKHESTWRPEAAGGEGRWLGLLQISPGTAEAYDCRAQDATALKRGDLNLSCGVRIMAETVQRDGVISEGRKGVAADWAPFSDPEKRADIQDSTKARPYCSA